MESVAEYIGWSLVDGCADDVTLGRNGRRQHTHHGRAGRDIFCGGIRRTRAPGAVLNILCGIWILLAAWLLDGGMPGWPWISVVSGLALIVFNLRCGPVEDRYGDWQRVIQ